ncbi:MAG: YdeI/OmpD-associated family protein [Chloroflexota bacterium]|nr:YdeI/OmpD-associated family protein [Chloroflexota bacterium]
MRPTPTARIFAAAADFRAWLEQNDARETSAYRCSAGHRVVGAKRDETRRRRLADLIAESAAGRRVKPFRYFEAQR